MKKIYIAGKVTGLSQDFVVSKFQAAKEHMEKKGFEVINPVEIVGDWETPWDKAMKMCISALVECDAIVMMPCALNSKGAMIERRIAEDLKMDILMYDDFRKEYANAKNTLGCKVLEELISMKMHDSFDKKVFVEKHWGRYDLFTMRCFDVAFCRVRKLLPDMNFKTKKGKIIRVEPEDAEMS